MVIRPDQITLPLVPLIPKEFASDSWWLSGEWWVVGTENTNRRDAVLLRMLKTPPKKHADIPKQPRKKADPDPDPDLADGDNLKESRLLRE